MDHQDMNKIAGELERCTRQQLRLAKLQCLFSVAAAVCCAALLIVVVSVVPKLLSLVDTTEALAQRANTVLTDLETVTGELAQSDLEQMVNNVNTLVDQSREGVAMATEGVAMAKEGVARAVERINEIDIKTLNQAIRDFSDVVEPLAKFFNIFDR